MSEPSGKAVFLSYASQDAEAARRIADALRAFGMEVWFDQHELRGGDAWDQKIRKQIQECTLFLPIISTATQERGEGYFRREWKQAADRTNDMAEGVPFLVPVVVDDTTQAAAAVPEPFLRVQWTRLAHGVPTPEFVAQVKRLLEAPWRPGAAGTRYSAARSGSAALGRRLPLWAAGTAAAVVLALVGYFAFRQPMKEGAFPKQAGADARPPTVPLSDKSIAVLPFDNLSEDKEGTAFFSDGMHEDVITSLANIRDLRVVSRTSVAEYRGTKKRVSQIARELSVAYILEGSVRRAGSSLRITGQLIRAATDEHVWAKSYDRELTSTGVFSIQAELATEIAAALHATISPETKKLLESRPTENLDAYDYYLKGRVWTRGRREQQQKVEMLLEAAVELDPNFATAWAELAILHGYIYRGNDNTPARLAKAEVAAARAGKLAPDAPATILSRGFLAYLGYRDYTRAIAEFERITRLQPNNALAFHGIAAVQKRQGRWREALDNFRRAETLDPGSSLMVGDLADALQFVRRWDEALSTLQRHAVLHPRFLFSQKFYVRVFFSATGSTKASEDLLSRLDRQQLESPEVISLRKWRASISSDFKEWQRLDALQPQDDTATGMAWEQAIDAAIIFAANGDHAGALRRLRNLPVEIRSRLELDSANDRLWNGLARLEAVLGRKAEALYAAKKATELVPESIDAQTGPEYARTLAMVYAWTGEKDRAIAELTRLARVPCGIESVHALRVDAAFAPLRGDPRFEALLNDPKNHAPLF